jgi:hypothetical protein
LLLNITVLIPVCYRAFAHVTHPAEPSRRMRAVPTLHLERRAAALNAPKAL